MHIIIYVEKHEIICIGQTLKIVTLSQRDQRLTSIVVLKSNLWKNWVMKM